MNVTLERHSENLRSISKLLQSEKGCAVTISPETAWIQDVLDEQQRKTQEAFKVLIVGAFNAGKSSMINALAGRDFLPTGDLPETGVVTELIYGEEFRITLYPKEGSGSTEPVVLQNPTVEAIKKYCSIDNRANMDNADATTENMRYERTVVECDIPLLKDGIMLIDTVGMNDPWGNDYITERYFPKADAIIYLMDSNHIYSLDDRKLLTRINDYGFRDLIIAYTKFGDVLYRNRRKPQSVIDEFCDVARRHAANHTDIGDAGIHFIDSLDGLEGKQTGDEDLVVRSGIAGLENFCANYLVENRGRIKIRTLNNSMQMLSNELESLANKIQTSATTDKGELLARIDKADEDLTILEENMKSSVLRFKNSVANAKPLLEASISSHVSMLAKEVDLDDYELQTQLPRGAQKLIPGRENKMADAIRTECQEELSRRMQAANKLWVSTKLTAQLEGIIRDGVEEISGELFDFYAQLDEIDQKLTAKNTSQKKKRTATDVATGIALVILTGNPASAIAFTHGAGSMGKSFAAQFGAFFGLALLGINITLPIWAATVFLSTIVATLTGNSEKKEQKIKADIIKQYRKLYDEAINERQTTIDSIVTCCNQTIDEATRRLEDTLAQEMDKKRKEILAMRETAEMGVAEKERLVSANNSALLQLEEIRRDGEKIAAEYN